MTVDKEVLIYRSTPYKKYRWISYITVLQVGLIITNTLFMPTKKYRTERKEAEARKVGRKKRDPSETDAQDQLMEETKPKSGTLLEQVQKVETNLVSLQNLIDNAKERPKTLAVLLGGSILMATALIFFARRSIHMITLLPKDRVKFSVFSPLAFSEPPTMTMALRDVSCRSPRDLSKNYSILKLRGYKGFHLVSTKDGEFLEPELYDEHVGVSRGWDTKR